MIMRHPCSPLAYSDFFFAYISILGRLMAQPGSPEIPGFSFSLSFFLSFLSTPTGWVEEDCSVRLVPRLCTKRLTSLRWKFLQKI